MAITLNGTTGITTPKLDALDLELGSRNVVERGSNANGEYVRFADGTQICTLRLSAGARNAVGLGTYADPYRTAVFPWTYSAAFSAAPTVLALGVIDSAAAQARANSVACSSVSNTQAQQIQAAMLTSESSNTTVSLDLAAIGRWF